MLLLFFSPLDTLKLPNIDCLPQSVTLCNIDASAHKVRVLFHFYMFPKCFLAYPHVITASILRITGLRCRTKGYASEFWWRFSAELISFHLYTFMTFAIITYLPCEDTDEIKLIITLISEMPNVYYTQISKTHSLGKCERRKKKKAICFPKVKHNILHVFSLSPS